VTEVTSSDRIPFFRSGSFSSRPQPIFFLAAPGRRDHDAAGTAVSGRPGAARRRFPAGRVSQSPPRGHNFGDALQAGRTAVHIVIMGCGRVGSTLAHILEDRGYSVAVIDQNPEAFRKLRSSFKGNRVTGMGFDRDVLIQAGIEEADAFAAVSSGDNSNIIAARVARESFGIDRVAARIYDPRRAEVYQRLGIPTVATVRWTADQMLRKLLPEGAEPLWRDPTGKIVLAEMAFSDRWLGEKVKAIEMTTGTRIAFIDRLGEAMIPAPGTVLQEGDVLHVIAHEDDLDRLTELFSTGPEGGR
jgi:trk system potassium uptake protein